MNSTFETSLEVIHPRGGRVGRPNDRAPRYLLPLLVPASWAYQCVSNALRSARSADVGPGPGDVRVVSVGNMEVGGSGKTPLAMHLIESIASRGGRPVYVSRGFQGASERLDVVTVVPAIRSPLPSPIRGVRYLRRLTPGLAGQIGDEGAMVARRLPEVPLVLCRSKRRALDVAVESYEPTHAVLDDAFQSWGVYRDVDIVLVDGRRPFGDGWLLPAGRLREAPEALERADVVGVNEVDNEEELEGTRGSIAAIGVRKPLFGIRRKIRVAHVDADTPVRPGVRYAALSAIGRPESFEHQLAADRPGLDVAFRYPDHYAYDRSDLEWILGEAERRGIDTLVTTEKDWAKLADLKPPERKFAVARLTLELFGADPLGPIEKAAD